MKPFPTVKEYEEISFFHVMKYLNKQKKKTKNLFAAAAVRNAVICEVCRVALYIIDGIYTHRVITLTI